MKLEVMLPPEDTRHNRFSYSRAAAWLRCGYAYSLRYQERLVRVIHNPPPWRGTLVHFGLSQALLFRHRGNSVRLSKSASSASINLMWKRWAEKEETAAVLDMASDAREDAERLRDESISIAERVIDRHDLLTGRWETITIGGKPLIEMDLRFDGFTCRPDWVAKDKDTGRTWLIDFKIRETIQPIEFEEWNMQAACYQHVLSRFGVHVTGSCAFQIRAMVPKTPSVNKTTKKGVRSMSRSVIATDWPTYKAALIREGMDPDEYIGMREKLNDFERLSFARRTPVEALNTFHMVGSILDAQKKGKLPVYRSITPLNCNRCEYNDFCMERLRGYDPDPSEFGLKKEDNGTDTASQQN